jgi:hypothetical protein
MSKAAQMELWPYDPTPTARAEPLPPNPSEGKGIAALQHCGSEPKCAGVWRQNGQGANDV